MACCAACGGKKSVTIRLDIVPENNRIQVFPANAFACLRRFFERGLNVRHLLARQIVTIFYVTLNLSDFLDYQPLLIRREWRIPMIFIAIIGKKFSVTLEI